MKDNDNLRQTYNTIAEDWVKDHDQDNWWQEGTETFLSFLPQGATILDVGCGGGIKTKVMSGKGYKVTGIDFSEKMIEIAKRELPELDFDVVDLYDLDTYKKMFDGIFVQAVLLHIPKVRIMEVLEKLKSRLNENGILYVAVKGMRANGVEERIAKENDYGYEYERFFSYFNSEELRTYFQKLGLKIVRENTFKSGDTDWLQIIGRKV